MEFIGERADIVESEPSLWPRPFQEWTLGYIVGDMPPIPQTLKGQTLSRQFSDREEAKIKAPLVQQKYPIGQKLCLLIVFEATIHLLRVDFSLS